MTYQVNKAISLDDLLEAGNWVEVIDGEPVEITATAGFIHNEIITNLYDGLKPFVKAHTLGSVRVDGLTYILHVDEHGVQTARIPDVSFISRAKILTGFDKSRPFIGAPDLAVEVVSPTETTADWMDKVSDYLRYGTELVWVIFPHKNELHQYVQSDHPPVIYKVGDTLEVDSLFPGLQIPIASVFSEE